MPKIVIAHAVEDIGTWARLNQNLSRNIATEWSAWRSWVPADAAALAAGDDHRSAPSKHEVFYPNRCLHSSNGRGPMTRRLDATSQRPQVGFRAG